MLPKGALNEVSYRGRFRVSLLTDGSKANRDGTKLRLVPPLAGFGYFLVRCPAKADSMNRPITQFGLAPHSVPFLLDWEYEARKYKSPL